jgi:hypothetical protein
MSLYNLSCHKDRKHCVSVSQADNLLKEETSNNNAFLLDTFQDCLIA